MCGLVGWVSPGTDASKGEKQVRGMVRALRHRGPDAQGYAAGGGWAVGHARLSIVDLTTGGQPIWNEDESILVIGNNEIYNAPELRVELERLGHSFRTRSDTEVLLHAWEQWGLGSFSRLNGMFAAALLDVKKRQLVLARDYLGIKPLHWVKGSGYFGFSSEIKALLGLPGFNARPNFDALHVFMNLRYLPGEQTLFGGVERVAPGSALVVDLDTLVTRRHDFFDWRQESIGRWKEGYRGAEEALSEILPRAVKRHLISDVEVAAYLSGGLDSSLVSSLAQRELSGLRTFCLGFGEPSDENSDAMRVAEVIHSRHSDLHVGGHALDHYERAIWHVEEPKINCIQGLVLAKEVASRGLKVALSGLGGDELFAGYTNNDILFPMTLGAGLLGGTDRGLSLAWLQRAAFGHGDLAFRAAELAANLRNPLQYYAILRNSFDHNAELMGSLYASPRSEWRGMTVSALKPYFEAGDPDLLGALLKLEMRTKLINDFLLTEDRVSMASSLEVRVPLLDKELAAFALSLPSSFKYRPGAKKRILRAAAGHWLPQDVLQKGKWGFSFNPVLLFDKELKVFAERVLTRERVEEMGLFSWRWIRRVLDQPASPRMRWHYFNLWVMAGVVIWHDLFFGERRHAFGDGGN